MAFQPVTDCVAVIIDQGSETSPWSNSLHFSRADFNEAAMDALGVAVFDAWRDNMCPLISLSFGVRAVTVYDLRADGAPVRRPVVTPAMGADNAEPIPWSDCLVVTTRTNQRGRSGRGRLYLSGFTETDMQAGVFLQGLANSALAAVAAAVGAGVALGWTRVVVSRYHDGVKRAVGVTYPATSELVRSLVPGKQSRRERRP